MLKAIKRALLKLMIKLTRFGIKHSGDRNEVDQLQVDLSEFESKLQDLNK